MKKRFDSYTSLHFALFRIVFGLYLCVHFIDLFSHAPDIWGREGMLGDVSLNLTFGKFPSLLMYINSAAGVQIFIAVLLVLAALLTVGVLRRSSALALWYGWACLFHQNNLISNPGLSMVGWLLLALALVPLGERLTLRKVKPDDDWYMPAPLYWGAWILTACAYTISGIDKFLAPSWRDGTAILHLLNNPLARDSFVREALLILPLAAIKIQTWAALTLEILFGPLCLFKKTRSIAWIAIMLMHMGILVIVDFADLTFGVIMIHLFTFNPEWFAPRMLSGSRPIVLFDGVCGMCNGWVNFLIDNDFRKRIRFAPLQSAFGQSQSTSGDSIILLLDGKVYDKSTAALRILRQLGGIWVFPSIFLLIPRTVRDWMYEVIAANRYKVFGKLDTCRIPTPEERERFLPDDYRVDEIRE